MSAHTTSGRMFGRITLGIVAAVVALMASGGVATAMPRTPLAADDPAPAPPPVDPSAVINIINQFASLIPALLGDQSGLSGLGGAGSGVPGLTSSTALIPALPSTP